MAAFARDRTTGALTQLAGTAGCVSVDGTGGRCATGFPGAQSVAVSKDGEHAYVTGSARVAVFVRDPGTGQLIELDSQAGCVSEDGSGGRCTDGKALGGGAGVALSPDGKHVYVASSGSTSAVAAFSRAK